MLNTYLYKLHSSPYIKPASNPLGIRLSYLITNCSKRFPCLPLTYLKPSFKLVSNIASNPPHNSEDKRMYRINPNKMKSADKIAFSALSGYMSLDEVSDKYRQGFMSQKDYRAFLLSWEWTAFRFSSVRQERCYQKMGSEAFYRRLERAKALTQRYIEKRFAYCMERARALNDNGRNAC